jgi:hypothetical protein
MRSRSSLKSGRGWSACPTATSAGSTSLSACSPSTPRTSASPYTRHLGGKVRELRFHLLRQQTRVTYWLAPGRRVILLTVFRKSRGAETAEVTRALRAQMICETQHSQAHDIFDREVD